MPSTYVLQTQNYDPKKLCGILIENVQEKHVGKWM